MQRIESIAFSEGVDEAQLMYNAGLAVANIASQMIEEVQSDKKVILLIGKGNNGGDAYVAGTFLLQRGYNVIAYQLFPRDKSSYLNRLHGDAFIKAGKASIRAYSTVDVAPAETQNEIVEEQTLVEPEEIVEPAEEDESDTSSNLDTGYNDKKSRWG